MRGEIERGFHINLFTPAPITLDPTPCPRVDLEFFCVVVLDHRSGHSSDSK